jgi:hypothetical protein
MFVPIFIKISEMYEACTHAMDCYVVFHMLIKPNQNQ